MNYVGVDIHKRYSVLVAVDERGRELARGRISGNSVHAFAQFFEALQGPGKVVLEACWNWGRIYDVLSEIEQVEEVVLAHPLKTWPIAEAQIKTDGLGLSQGVSALASAKGGSDFVRGIGALLSPAAATQILLLCLVTAEATK